MPLTEKQRIGLLSPAKTHEWGTPQELFNDLNQEFRFTLDVAASNENAKCDQFYTIADDGLIQPWVGRCWMNPPYGREIRHWVKKADESNCLVVGLLPARTDTAWFHEHCLHHEIRWIRGRLYFNDGEGRCPFPNMVVIFS